MSDLKRKASSEVDASEEPTAKRHQSTQDLGTMTHGAIINSADAWNRTEEATVDDASPNQSVPAHDGPAQDGPAQDGPAQDGPAQEVPTQVTSAQQAHSTPSQDVPAQVVAALNNHKRASKPRPKSAEPNSDKSARQLLRESMEDPGQNLRERGTVRNVDGDLQWVASDGTLVPCVYHNSIRAELIAEASKDGTTTYDVHRKHGNLEYNATDVTAYHPEQRTWSEERNLWPNIRDNILNRLERKGYKELYGGQDPGKMMHKGRLVVDHDNHPVYLFPDLPTTLSSAIEGWWLEAVTRLDSRIDRMDFRARLPAFRGKTSTKKESAMYGLSAIGNRRLRFRDREGLIAWDSRVGSDHKDQFYKSRLPSGCVERNTTEGGGPLNSNEKEHAEGLNKGKPEHADKAKGRKRASTMSSSPDNAAGQSSSQNFGSDGPAPVAQATAAAPSTPPRGQQSQSGSPVFGAPGAHTPGFAPQVNLNRPSNGGTSADIPIARGLKPAQVLDQYRILSSLTGQSKDDFDAAIEAVTDEEESYAALRPRDNNRREQNGRGTGETNEFNTFEQPSNMPKTSHANEYAEDAFLRPDDVQPPNDVTGNNDFSAHHSDAALPKNKYISAGTAPELLPPPPQKPIIHNTVGDEHWVPDLEEIDEAFWEKTMNKAWSPAGDHGNDQPNVEDAQPAFDNAGEDTAPLDVPTALFNSRDQARQIETSQPSSGQNHFSPDPLFDEFFPGDEVVPSQQALQPQGPQSSPGQIQFFSDSFWDLSGPANDSAPTQQALQPEAPQASAGQDQAFPDPLFVDDLVPELTAEDIQEIVASLGTSGDFTNYGSSLLEQGLPEEPLAPAETARAGSKRKTMDQGPSNGNKRARSQGDQVSYTPYKPRQDKPHVPMPGHTSSTPAPHLRKGFLPTPTTTPQKPSTPGSIDLMPPPHHQPLPAYKRAIPPLGGNPLPTPDVTPEKSFTPQLTPSRPPQRHQSLAPYQSPIPRIPATSDTPTPIPTPAAPTAHHSTPSRPAPPPATAQPDHRYTTPTNPSQRALIRTLLEPTRAQFRGLMQGTPYADHVVPTDMGASYMTQYEHIGRELEVLWRAMNWDGGRWGGGVGMRR